MRVNGQRKVLGVLSALVCVTAAIVLAARASGQDEGGLRLEGAWIAKVVQGPAGQWDYTLSPDPSGRRASMNGAVVVHFPGSPTPSDLLPLPLVGEAIQTGPDTAVAEVLFHVVHNNQVVSVGRAHATVRYLGPGKMEETSQFDFYLPGPDGLPTGDPLPGRSFAVISVDTRVPSPVRR
ncbi:MAG: hypothetical protein ACM3NQ_17105 [Bacteroidales bacterium]